MYYGVQKNLKLTRTVIRGGAEQRVSETLTIDDFVAITKHLQN